MIFLNPEAQLIPPLPYSYPSFPPTSQLLITSSNTCVHVLSTKRNILIRIIPLQFISVFFQINNTTSYATFRLGWIYGKEVEVDTGHLSISPIVVFPKIGGQKKEREEGRNLSFSVFVSVSISVLQTLIFEYEYIFICLHPSTHPFTRPSVHHFVHLPVHLPIQPDHQPTHPFNSSVHPSTRSPILVSI